MVCTSLGSLLCPLFYFLCYIHFSLSVEPIPTRGIELLFLRECRMQIFLH